MRIAIITREYPPETPWGGIASFYRHLATALRDHGHDVEVFAQGIYREHSETVEGVTVHRVLARNQLFGELTGGDLAGNSDLGDFAFSLAQEFLRAFLRRHHEAPFEIAEGHEHLGVNAFINLHAPKGLITVTRYHTSYHSLVKRRLVDWPESSRITALEQLSLDSAQYRIATSRFIDQITREDFGLSTEAPVLSNFGVAPASATSGLPDREKLIIFAGRLVLEHKRPDLAAFAFARLANDFPEWRIEFAGPDMELPDKRTTWQICASHLAGCSPDRFSYRGVLDPAAMDHYYRRARILIVPSKFESFGMVAIEAMLRGCVPIVADQTALIDATNDPTLEFRNGDLDDLVDRLRRLMADDALWTAKSEACRIRANTVFNSEYLFKQNVYLFDSLRARRASRTIRATPENDHLPTISIVTPSYNQGQYIEETIASVLYQDYPCFEHVVVDGGSTDDTLRILKKYPHLRWISEPDQGQTHAINKGILATTGEIVAYLNSDDVYRSGAFHAVAKLFRDHPEIHIVVGNCDVIDGESKIVDHLKAKSAGLAELVQYWRWGELHCIPQQSVFFRRSLIAEIGLFEPRFHMVMDYNFWMRVVQIHPFFVLDQTLAAFRIVPTSKTGGRTTEMYAEEYQASREFWPMFPIAFRINLAFGARRQVSRKMLDVAEHLLLRTSKGKRPLELLKTSLSYWPPQALNIRFSLTLAGALVKGPGSLSGKLTRLHFRYLGYLWRRRQRA